MRRSGAVLRRLLDGRLLRDRGTPGGRSSRQQQGQGGGGQHDYGVDGHGQLDHPELTVFELRSGSYEQTAHVAGDQEYRAVIPFPATVVPSQLVTIG